MKNLNCQITDELKFSALDDYQGSWRSFLGPHWIIQFGCLLFNKLDQKRITDYTASKCLQTQYEPWRILIVIQTSFATCSQACTFSQREQTVADSISLTVSRALFSFKAVRSRVC